MYKRSELRHACFRAKKNAATADNLVLLSKLEPLLVTGQRWENFAVVWDLIVSSSGEIKIINPETDIDFVKTICQEKSFCVKYQKEREWNDREQNIITIVESGMLVGLMKWETYGQKWGVDIDVTLKMITTKLFRESTQKEVTEEMILASRVSDDASPYVGEQPIDIQMEVKPMTAEETNQFEQFLNTVSK